MAEELLKRKDYGLIDEQCNEMVRLVEERGVGGYRWKKEINDIYIYIRRYIKKAYRVTNSDKIYCIVPRSLTNKIWFIHNLRIQVIGELSNTTEVSGGGSIQNNGTVEFLNGKITNLEIQVVCNFDSNGKLIGKTLLGTLYHEINHAYDAYMDMYRTRNLGRFIRDGEKANLGHELGTDNFFGCVIYRLFAASEFNSLVASVYGDLMGMDSSRKNFSNDIKKTQAYTIYRLLKEVYERAINKMDVYAVNDIYDRMLKVGITLNMVKPTVGAFKNAFKHKVEIYLDKLIKGIGRTASLWYDTKEAQEAKKGQIRRIDPAINKKDILKTKF